MKKIIIVEDERELAINIQELLTVLGYEVLAIFNNAKSCIDFLATQTADLVLIDITIKGNDNGIELAKQISSKHQIPLVFCTAHSDYSILQQIRSFTPAGYIVKPFSLELLKATLYLALNKNNYEVSEEQLESRILNVRDKGLVVPLETNKIIAAEADGLYTKIITEEKTYLIRDILKNVEKKLHQKQFIRVHKSYLINLAYATSYNSKLIKINHLNIPIKRGFYKTLQTLLN